MGRTKEPSLDRAKELINQRRFTEAGRVLRDMYVNDYPETISAYFWFQCHLAASLDGMTGLAHEFWQRAEQCDDYSETMRGDFIRDDTLRLIRDRRRLELPEVKSKIRANLDEMRHIFSGDSNRTASVVMTEARYQAAFGNHVTAARFYQYADTMWSHHCVNPDFQWMHNNWFRWLISLPQMTHEEREWIGQEGMLPYLVRDLMHDDKNWERRVATRAMYIGGRPVARVIGRRS